jgi:hypothetical protein
MRRHGLCGVVLLAVFTVSVLGQTETSMPSKDELLELLNKANEKISGFEQAVKMVKPDLDKVDSKLSTNYLNAATAAHTLIHAMQKAGPTGYGLVGLVATIDDLSLDAATASVQLLIQIAARAQGGLDVSLLNPVTLLMTSKNECYDIGELIMHATLRYIYVEEQVLAKLLEQPSKKK